MLTTLRVILARVFLALPLAAASSGCAALAAHQKESEAHEKAIADARGACYEVTPAIAYSESYALLSSQYKIARESEKRGFVETDWKEASGFVGKTRTKVAAEVAGEGCLRIVLRVEAESKVEGKEWTAGDGAETEGNLYLELNRRLKQRTPTK